MTDDDARKRQDNDFSDLESDNHESGIAGDFATAPGISRRERRAFQRLTEVLRFTDFMTLMMVLATALSAYATWRTAYVTSLLFAVAERPYMGVEQIKVDSIDGDFARVAVDCRNFGQVQATGGVARISVKIDGKALPASNTVANTENIGIVSPTVPHVIFRFVPESLYRAVRDGLSRMIVHVEFAYLGPDQRQFCYSKVFSYDHRTDAFIPSGGTDKCGSEVY